MNNGHCYGFVDQSLSWYNARDYCKQIGVGYDLVTIEDNEENQFLKNKIRTNFNGNEYWVGAKESNNGNDFVWVDGSDVTYTDWKSGEPNEVRNCSSFYHSIIKCYIRISNSFSIYNEQIIYFFSYSLETVKKSVFVFTTTENGQIDHVKITIDSFVKEASKNPVIIFKYLVIGIILLEQLIY